MPLVIGILTLFWLFVLVLTGARFLVLLFNANRDSEIVGRILRHSDFWVKPFFDLLGLSNEAIEETGGFFEPASAIAFVVYFVIGAVILSALRGGLSGGWGWRRGGWRHA